MRIDGKLPDDPLIHACALTFASDLTLLDAVLSTHGEVWGPGGYIGASLDHALWFHRPFRADEWFLYDCTSPSASGSRGLANGRMYAQDGRLIASAVQEGLLRRIGGVEPGPLRAALRPSPPPIDQNEGHNRTMRLSARVDYALRAVTELASAQLTAAGAPADDTGLVAAALPMTSERLASAQQIPAKFLESILVQLRRGGVVSAQRGPEGGYWLTRPASEISLAEVIRVIDGPLAHVRGTRPEDLGYHGVARPLQDVWIALRASEREILDMVTIADVASGDLPERVRELVANPKAWA